MVCLRFVTVLGFQTSCSHAYHAEVQRNLKQVVRSGSSISNRTTLMSSLDAINVTIQKVQSSSKICVNSNSNILELPPNDREAVGVSSKLCERILNLTKIMIAQNVGYKEHIVFAIKSIQLKTHYRKILTVCF